MNTTHKHTNWTGRPCEPCKGTGEIDRDPACEGACRQPEFCSCPHKCGDCAGTGDEHGEVPAEQCGDSDCPERKQ